jgi:hypothetical protein
MTWFLSQEEGHILGTAGAVELKLQRWEMEAALEEVKLLCALISALPAT